MSGAKVCTSCRSRQELSKEYFFCKIWRRYSRERASLSLEKMNELFNPLLRRRTPRRKRTLRTTSPRRTRRRPRSPRRLRRQRTTTTSLSTELRSAFASWFPSLMFRRIHLSSYFFFIALFRPQASVISFSFFHSQLALLVTAGLGETAR